MNDARSLGGKGSMSVCPGPHLVRSDSEKRDEAESPVAKQGQPVQGRLIQVKIRQKTLALRRIQLAKFLFDLGRNSDPLEGLCTKFFLQRGDQVVSLRGLLPTLRIMMTALRVSKG